jgi:hypothetical protein
MNTPITIQTLLDGHVTLQLECLDRLYLNGYVPRLQTGGGLISFLAEHRRHPIASPALLGQITQDYVARARAFAQQQGIPWVLFERGQSKDALAKQMRAQRGVRDDVVFIGVAQEKAKAFNARKLPGSPIRFEFTRDKSVFVNYHYYYVDDPDWGEAFLKVCTYAPWGLKLYLNGHEWLKRQLVREGIRFEALDNGFLSCESPARLQALADTLGPEQVQGFLKRWSERLPLPLTAQDRAAGFDYQLSLWQVEVSLTQVLDRPLAGRQFFEEVIRDNLDLGRPDRVQLLFPRKITRRTPGRFRTRVIQQGVHPSLHIEYKHFDLKQYFKEGRALRTEGTFREAKDFDLKKGLENLPQLQELGRQINRRLLEVERVSHNCGVSAACIQSVVQPTVTKDGQRASGLKLGDRRVMALMLALTMFGFLVHGFRNRELREKVAVLLGCQPGEYGAGRMSYDLRRLRYKGLIVRVEDSQRYYLTPEGWKLSRLYARLEARVFRPLLTVMEGSVHGLPPPLERALDAVDAELDQLLEGAIPMKKAA